MATFNVGDIIKANYYKRDFTSEVMDAEIVAVSQRVGNHNTGAMAPCLVLLFPNGDTQNPFMRDVAKLNPDKLAATFWGGTLMRWWIVKLAWREDTTVTSHVELEGRSATGVALAARLIYKDQHVISVEPHWKNEYTGHRPDYLK